ncbi:MAG TPA: HAMP domain-containing histidine kinase [Candidatus Cloacimonetes bacterium]|nr:HAMP domain-containing histidine kinase [Candidatus Cloacimonadota bacterium]
MQSYKHIVRDENKIRGMFPLVVLLAFFLTLLCSLPSFCYAEYPDQELEISPEDIYFNRLHKEIISKAEMKVVNIYRYWLIVLTVLSFVLFITLSLLLIYVLKLKNSRSGAPDSIDKEVEERTENLNYALQKAHVEEMIRSAYLATSVHELRNFLNNVIGLSGIMLDKSSGEINAQQEKIISHIKESSQHIMHSINDAHEAYKLATRQQITRMEEFELLPFLEYLIGSFSVKAKEKGLQLRLKPLQESHMIYSDKGRLEQILINLLSNAIKYTDKGFVEISCEREDESIHISVSDSGTGVPDKLKDMIFRPFIKGEKHNEGSGLGLYISNELTKLIGGEISLQSTSEQGSSFCITLPVKGTT